MKEPVFRYVVLTPKLNLPAANTAAVITLAAITGQRQVINLVAWSYSGTPTGGNLKIEDDTTSVLDLDITASGPGSIIFGAANEDGGLASSLDKKLVITLAAGGTGITGKVHVQAR